MFAVRTKDKLFTEAHYENFSAMYMDWWYEFACKTHYYIHISV